MSTFVIRHSILTLLLLLILAAAASVFAEECPTVAAWDFDDDSADGFLTNGIDRVDGVTGKSLRFSGEGTIVTLPDSDELTNGLDAFAIIVWANPYRLDGTQQMIAGKNRYRLNQRQWGVMIDKNDCFTFYARIGGQWKTVVATKKPTIGSWHQLVVTVQKDEAEFYVNGRSCGTLELSQPLPATEAPVTLGAIDDAGRIWQEFSGAIDQVRFLRGAMTPADIAAGYRPIDAKHTPPPQPQPFMLFTGPSPPRDPAKLPFVPDMKTVTVHAPTADQYKFLHGAAIVEHRGTMYACWANSPLHENGPEETLRGRRSTDDGLTWGPLEIIAPGFPDSNECHSHGAYLEHEGKLWVFSARFGDRTTPGRRFPGLVAEAFVLDDQTGQWQAKGPVMKNCWLVDEPVLMDNGNYITAGQDKDGYPVVAISDGGNLLKWESILIPWPAKLAPSFAETSVVADDSRVLAVIRGGAGCAWVATSDDFGRTWTTAAESNMPMPRAKPYLGRLSDGRLYMISNLVNRDTLILSVGEPGQLTLSKSWRIRHGRSEPPIYPGSAKSPQWSYPYAHEHDGKLYVVYSVGKENCDLSILPIDSLSTSSP